MNKRLILVLLLAAALVLLCACQGGEPQTFQVYNPATVTTPPTAEPYTGYDFDSGDYDPSSEEGVLDEVPEEYSGLLTEPPQAAYAGATPVLIDPINKPTPSPAPQLSIDTYQVYDATKLGLSFEGPIGWNFDDSASDAYSIYNPDTSVNYPAQLTIHKVPVSSNYTKAQLKAQVQEMLTALKPRYSSFSPSLTAERTLLDSNGIYADFTGVDKESGEAVWGRVQAVCVQKNLYILEMTTPQVYKETYKDTLYSRFRKTLKITK